LNNNLYLLEDSIDEYKNNIKDVTTLINERFNEYLFLRERNNTFENDINNNEDNPSNPNNIYGDSIIKTGFEAFDKHFYGLAKKNLIILGGRPSMGKSTLALQIALNVAKQGKTVLYFSQEMTNTENINKILANRSGIDSRYFTYGIPNDETLEKTARIIVNAGIGNYKLYLDDKAKIDINYITRIYNRLKLRVTTIDLIIVDHLQITEDIKKNFSKIDKYGNITTDLKSFAKDNNCIVLCLSQLNRKSEEREGNIPELSDLRESGDIEQNADQVIFINRQSYYLERKLQSLSKEDSSYEKILSILSKVKNQAKLYLKKNRNGILGDITLYFNPKCSLFGDYVGKDEGS
jgi:replicative DNA helicase